MKNLLHTYSVVFLKTIVLAAALFLLTDEGRAQEQKVSQQALIRDTQQSIGGPHRLGLIWWIPEQYWRVSFAANPNMTEDQIKTFIKVVKPYTIIVVVRGELGPMGGVTYENEADIRSKIVLTDGSGVHYTPLGEEAISADMQNFMSMMKPIFGNMLGNMGKNMNLYLFPADGKDGKPIANALDEGKFTVNLAADAYKWRLPLGSLLPEKTCSKCGEKLSGAYKFCPYDGTPLDK